MVTFELVEYFSGLGDEVMVVTFGIGGDWTREFAALDRVTAIRYDDPDLDATIVDFAPTIVWIHHQLVPAVLMREPRGITFVFHHMSITHPIEFPLAHRVERDLASAIAFVSPEALAIHVESGLLDGVPDEKLSVLGNPAPAYFSRTTAPGPELRSVLMVSNHAPAELSEALEAMSATCEVVALGTSTGMASSIRRVMPSDLDRADAVISIGKTVQFGLVTGTPVYCYDHFGGPGWIDESTIELARFHNFSGRGFARKSAAVIRDELIQGYAAAAAFASESRQRYATEFRVDAVVESLLSSSVPHDGSPLDSLDVTAHEWELTLRNGLLNAIEARVQTIDYLEGRLAAASMEAASLAEAAQSKPSFRQRVRLRLSRRI